MTTYWIPLDSKKALQASDLFDYEAPQEVLLAFEVKTYSGWEKYTYYISRSSSGQYILKDNETNTYFLSWFRVVRWLELMHVHNLEVIS